MNWLKRLARHWSRVVVYRRKMEQNEWFRFYVEGARHNHHSVLRVSVGGQPELIFVEGQTCAIKLENGVLEVSAQ